MSEQPPVEIRGIYPVAADILKLTKRHQSVLQLILKKIEYLQLNPGAGVRLAGDLSEFKKVTVGNRAWRIIFQEQMIEGTRVIEILEIWGIGSRTDGDVYDEVRARLKSMPPSPMTISLYEILLMLQNPKFSLAEPTHASADPIPEWLATRLKTELGYSDSRLIGMTGAQAMDIWDDRTQN
jgi:mRNA interferase RelE/StbE